jgi:hypothetical protein
MSQPVSVQLDDEVRATLEGAAKERGIELSTYLRELAAAEAERVRRERIRVQSRAVAAYVASSAEATAFYDDWEKLSAEIEAR